MNGFDLSMIGFLIMLSAIPLATTELVNLTIAVVCIGMICILFSFFIAHTEREFLGSVKCRGLIGKYFGHRIRGSHCMICGKTAAHIQEEAEDEESGGEGQ